MKRYSYSDHYDFHERYYHCYAGSDAGSQDYHDSGQSYYCLNGRCHFFRVEHYFHDPDYLDHFDSHYGCYYLAADHYHDVSPSYCHFGADYFCHCGYCLGDRDHVDFAAE